jgi:nucleotide-binding universal stress UspA family protein
MTQLRSILVAVDGSPSSIAALDHAVELGRDYGADVRVLHVVSTSDTVAAPAETETASEPAIARAQRALGSKLSQITAVGDPTREIVAAGRDADLIVMGTHGRGGRLHALLGSVAESVVRNAPCPVLTVREPGEGYQSFNDRRHHRPSMTGEGAETARRHG